MQNEVMDEHKGWYTRRRLPHFDGAGNTQFITFRLADSLPQALINEVREELRSFKGNIEREKELRSQAILDKGIGSCLLGSPEVARIVQDSICFLDEKRYDLYAWVVMPNHVHLLARFNEGQSWLKAMHSLKSFTAHEIKKIHPELATVWQHESFDRYIRNADHFSQVINYIHENPVVAGLCDSAEEFCWSSAYRGR